MISLSSCLLTFNILLKIHWLIGVLRQLKEKFTPRYGWNIVKDGAKQQIAIMRNFHFQLISYGVCISQLSRHSRACGYYHDFLDRELLLRRKLLNQGFLMATLKTSHQQFYGLHHDLADRYVLSVSPMTTDMSRIFLSMCDVKIFLTFTSPNMVLLWQLFYLFCSCI
jgi:hypothetical protein